MKKYLVTLLFCALGAQSVQAVEATLEQQAESRLISAFGPRLEVRAAERVAGKQMLEITLIDGTLIHMTPDMNYFIYRDELFQLTAGEAVNVTQSRLSPKRLDSMKKIKDSDTVFFAAKGKQKAVINVFTDIECGFCQKLHLEVPKLNEMGIAVRYLAFPRAGVKDRSGQYTDAYRKIDAVWCADDRTDTMTTMKSLQRNLGLAAQKAQQGNSGAEKDYYEQEAKMNKVLARAKHCQSPGAVQSVVGDVRGVTGTPAIITEKGELIPGYMPAEELAKRIGL